MPNTSLLFDQSLQKLNVLFKYSGMNLQNKIKTPLDSLKYRWLYIFNLMWVMSATIACFYYIILGVSQGKNFVELTSVAPCLTFTILAIFKSFFHIMYEHKIFDIIDGLRELEIKELKRNRSAEKDQIIKADRRFLNAVINGLYFLNCSMIVVFDLSPLLLIAVKYIRKNELEMLLPYLDVFSFIPYEFKYWPFAYIHQVWSECIVLLEMSAADFFFFTCCTYIKMHFGLLKNEIQKIIPECKTPEEVIEDPEFRNKFLELVKWHQDLIECSNLLEVIYSKSNLFNFLSSSLVICLTGFNVTVVDDITVALTFLTFLFMGLMQVFFLCFFADLLMTASIEVGDAVYNTYWYMVSKALQVICRGVADVNLRAFMKVLSTSWSYFALLQTVYGQP